MEEKTFFFSHGCKIIHGIDNTCVYSDSSLLELTNDILQLKYFCIFLMYFDFLQPDASTIPYEHGKQIIILSKYIL